MEPSKKAPAMEAFLEENFGRTTAIKADRCTLSRREYAISGLCQTCQDIAFTPPKEDESA